jgi:4'-phosphopantetheinyl transferase
VVDPPVAFNVSHDNALVAMAFAAVNEGDAPHAPAYRLGVDVMNVVLPRGETLSSFVNTFADQASAHSSPPIN